VTSQIHDTNPTEKSLLLFGPTRMAQPVDREGSHFQTKIYTSKAMKSKTMSYYQNQTRNSMASTVMAQAQTQQTNKRSFHLNPHELPSPISQEHTIVARTSRRVCIIQWGLGYNPGNTPSQCPHHKPHTQPSCPPRKIHSRPRF